MHGSRRKAAAALKCAKSAIDEALARVRKKAALQGFSPAHDWTHPVPSTHVAKGVSTYYPSQKDDEGRSIGPGQWVKADLRQEAYNELVKGAIA